MAFQNFLLLPLRIYCLTMSNSEVSVLSAERWSLE
jgi:hypothetical protein